MTPSDDGDPPRDRDEGTGQFTPEYSDEEFVEAVGAHGPDAPTKDVAAEVGCDASVAYRRLLRLAEEGRVSYRRVGTPYLWTVESEYSEK